MPLNVKPCVYTVGAWQCHALLLTEKTLRRRDFTGNCACRHRGRRGKMRYALGSLSADEISIGSAEATFTGRHLIIIHGQTHGASGHTKLRAGRLEYFVQTFSLCL